MKGVAIISCNVTVVNQFNVYLHANIDYSSQRVTLLTAETSFCLPNTKQKRKTGTFPTERRGLCVVQTSISCTFIYSQSVSSYIRLTQLRLQLHGSHGFTCRTQGKHRGAGTQKKNHKWKQTWAVHLMIISGSSANSFSCLHSWTEKVYSGIADVLIVIRQAVRKGSCCL